MSDYICPRRANLFLLLNQYLDNLDELDEVKKAKYRKRFWVRKIFNKEGKKSSDYNLLVNQLRLDDKEFHFKYTRMSKARVDHLFSLIEERIAKKDTNFRPAIPAPH